MVSGLVMRHAYGRNDCHERIQHDNNTISDSLQLEHTVKTQLSPTKMKSQSKGKQKLYK